MTTVALIPHGQHQLLEVLLDRLLSAADAVIAALDELDGDADLEPALGAAETGRWSQLRWATPAADDREEQCEDEGSDTPAYG